MLVTLKNNLDNFVVCFESLRKNRIDMSANLFPVDILNRCLMNFILLALDKSYCHGWMLFEDPSICMDKCILLVSSFVVLGTKISDFQQGIIKDLQFARL
jgi:hypothetical protein